MLQNGDFIMLDQKYKDAIKLGFVFIVDDKGVRQTIISRKQALELGLKYYFTGKPCKHGHIMRRDITCKSCLTCRKNNNAKWYKSNVEKAKDNAKKWKKCNPEKVKEINRNWKKCNPEKVKKWYKYNSEKARENNAKWRKENPEKVRENNEKWRKENPEKARGNSSKWRKENPEKARESTAKWYRNNQEKARLYRMNRRARLKFIKTNFSVVSQREMMIAQSYACNICKTPFIFKKECTCHTCRRIKDKSKLNSDLCYHADHIIALASAEEYGKTVYHPEDFQLLCPPCNLRKGKKSMKEFIESIS